MNTEEKAAYMAQYWGQHVLRYTSWRDDVPTRDVQFEIAVDSHVLILTPLSAITDKDAIEVAKIYWGKTDFTSIDHTKRVLDSLIQKTDVADYLRSKGYALPFRNYSVEQLIELGWLKLKP